jgi:hypothetical protein
MPCINRGANQLFESDSQRIDGDLQDHADQRRPSIGPLSIYRSPNPSGGRVVIWQTPQGSRRDKKIAIARLGPVSAFGAATGVTPSFWKRPHGLRTVECQFAGSYRDFWVIFQALPCKTFSPPAA